MKDYEGNIRTGATSLDSEWIAWSDTTAPGVTGNNFADLTAAADNTIEKAMARLYMVATNYLDAAISSRATPAQVSTQVAAELATTTYAEPAQGTPPATTDLRSKIGYLYKAWRNRTTQTATLYRVYNDDATTADHKSSFSDDGTTADRGEVATGP